MTSLTMPTCCGDPWQFWWIVFPIYLLIVLIGSWFICYDRQEDDDE